MKKAKLGCVVVLGISLLIISVVLISGGRAEAAKPKTAQELRADSIFQAKKERSEKLKDALFILEAQIKKSMNDPDSYELVQRAWDPKDSVKTKVKLMVKFRGNNAFGGKIVNTVWGTYDFETDNVNIDHIE